MPQPGRGRSAPAQHADARRRRGTAAVVAANTDAVPATSTHTPCRVAPQARNDAAVSPQPATTGVPAFSPQRAAAPRGHRADHRLRLDDPRQLRRGHAERPAQVRVPAARGRCRQSR